MSTDPGVANVSLGVGYQINSATKTGTMINTDPGISNVSAGVTYEINSVIKVGTLGSISSPTNRAYVLLAEQVIALADIQYAMLATPGSPVSLLARIIDDQAALILPANIASISVVITDMMADIVGNPISLAPTASILPTCSVSGWTLDAIGYNTILRLAGSNFPAARTTYQIAATFTPVANGGSPFEIVWQLETADVI
jgi:hypothetical protein